MASKSSKVPPLGKTFAAIWTSLFSDMFNAYRPERHYMRGPGPKWRAKHQTPIATDEPAGDYVRA